MPYNLKKILFYSIFTLFTLIIFFLNNGVFPFWGELTTYPNSLIEIIIKWVNVNLQIFKEDTVTFTTKNNDTAFNYLKIILFTIIAILSAFILNFVKPSISYDKLKLFLIELVSIYLALNLVFYGFSKLLKIQFPSPDLYTLTQTYGSSSPMHLAWTFLGYSDGYNYFMGIIEIASIFILFKSTRALGVLISLCCTSNIMFINYCFDLPVKIISSILFIMTLFLFFIDYERYWKFFIKGKSLREIPESFISNNNTNYTIHLDKIKFAIFLPSLIFCIINLFNYKNQLLNQPPKPREYGIYYVEYVVYSDSFCMQHCYNNASWSQIIIESENLTIIKYCNDSVTFNITQWDRENQTITYSDLYDSYSENQFSYAFYNDTKLKLKGKLNGINTQFFLTRKIIPSFRLTSRKFHWINEHSYYF